MQSDFLQQLYEENALDLVIFATKQLHDEHKAADLVDEVFLLAIYKVQNVVKSPNPVGWLFNALKLEIKRELRKPQYIKETALEMEILSQDFTDNMSLADQLPQQLDTADRKMLIWYDEEQRTCAEIAKKCGISAEACRMRLSRSRSRYKKLLIHEKSL